MTPDIRHAAQSANGPPGGPVTVLPGAVEGIAALVDGIVGPVPDVPCTQNSVSFNGDQLDSSFF